MHPEEDRVLDAAQWQVEAESVINDVKAHVHELQVSPALPSSNSSIHLNLTTLENFKFCLRLSAEGFSVVGDRHDCADKTDSELQHYETIYALLDSVSPRYRASFGRSLFDKLQQLSDNQDGER